MIRFLFFISLFILPRAEAAVSLVLVGKIPGEYVGRERSEAHFGFVAMEGRLVKAVRALEFSELSNSLAEFPEARVVYLNRGENGSYDIIYPGLINLHNHTKQNVLPVWGLARGQFENRFEWRPWGDYKKSVSGNMNPWIGFGSPLTCAAFRWSELMAITQGTTYLQGPSSCVDNFGIHRVEDAKAFLSKKKAVQAPTDTIIPADMVFVWNTLGPRIRRGQTYEEALSSVLTEGDGEWSGCPGLRGIVNPNNVNSPEVLAILSDQDQLREACGIVSKEAEEKLPPKFVRYVYWVHKTIASRKSFLRDPNYSAVITHLAEGRAGDPYNQREFQILEMLGLIGPRINLVHAVGVDDAGIAKMIQTGMGVVWSPFSNLLLYGETLNLRRILRQEKAQGAKLLIALGSDWTPTGTKGVLEELSVASAYIDEAGLGADFSDESLYRMVTENPARMIGHWEIDPSKGEHGIGRIAEGAMASLIVLDSKDPNPYRNLVRHGGERTLGLVVVDGRPVYGKENYLQAAGFNLTDAEVLSLHPNLEDLSLDPSLPALPASLSGGTSDDDDEGSGGPKKDKEAQLARIAGFLSGRNISVNDACGFTEKRYFVRQNSLAANGLEGFRETSGLDLDRYQDIAKLLGISLLTQSRNRASKVDPEFLVDKFPPLLACNNLSHSERVRTMILPEGRGQRDIDARDRSSRRARDRLGEVPRKLAESYPEL